MNLKKNIFIVVPAYNEAKNIARVLTDLLKLASSPLTEFALSKACPEFTEGVEVFGINSVEGYNYQVVVVDDGSSDNTYEICKIFPVKVLHHALNRGQGAALQTGTEYAVSHGADVIIHFDGDGQFLAGEIRQMVEPILSHQVDIVLGSRFYADSNMPFLKKYIILPIAKIINWLLTGIKLTDAHCGFRAMNKEAAEKIKITQDGMSHNTEIVAQIKKHQLKFKEVPVTVIYHEFGQGVSGGFRILKELLLGKIIKN